MQQKNKTEGPYVNCSYGFVTLDTSFQNFREIIRRCTKRTSVVVVRVNDEVPTVPKYEQCEISSQISGTMEGGTYNFMKLQLVYKELFTWCYIDVLYTELVDGSGRAMKIYDNTHYYSVFDPSLMFTHLSPCQSCKKQQPKQ